MAVPKQSLVPRLPHRVSDPAVNENFEQVERALRGPVFIERTVKGKTIRWSFDIDDETGNLLLLREDNGQRRTAGEFS